MSERSIVIGTAGHIDHGKSALIRSLTGTDPDRLKEEQERGITIDLGFAHLRNLAFVDVPGHERFVKNMLAGVGGIDLVMLVVAADESVMPQTREHFHICRLLRVPSGLVVLTKSDATDPEMLELARLEVTELVAGSFLTGAPVVAVSARTGAGLDALEETLVTMAASVPARRTAGPVRLPIDRVFSMRGFGTVVTGTLKSGCLTTEQDVVLLPKALDTKIRGLQVHGRPETSVEAGHRVAVNLGGVDVAEIARGDALVDRGAFESTRRLDVALELLPEARPLRPNARVRFHAGTAEILGRVALAREGQPIHARIHLEAPAVVTRGDRFILRTYSPADTFAGGVVLDPRPPRTGMRSAAGLERFRRIDTSSGDAALAVFVEEAHGAGLPKSSLVSRAGLSYDEADCAAERLVSSGVATLVGDLLVSIRVRADLAERLVTILQAHHRANPLAGGMPREEARERVFGRASVAIFEAVLEDLVSAGRLVARDRLALEGHHVSLSPEEARAQRELERVYLEANLTPPDLAVAASEARVGPGVATRVVGLLVRSRVLVKVDTLLFHAASLDRLKADVRGLKGAGTAARVDVASFKERYGVSRKYAIPLLEYLDRERVTKRMGENRIVL
jgi:selenocysteine-specific elongation factor